MFSLSEDTFLKYGKFFIIWWNEVYFLDKHFVSFMSDKLILKGKINVHFLLFFFGLDFQSRIEIISVGCQLENPNIWRRENTKITGETPRSSEKALAWGRAHLYKLPSCMKLLRIFAMAHGRPIYMAFVIEANHTLSQIKGCLMLNK